jgi:hypothetical protein
MMCLDMEQITTNLYNLYRIRLQGALNNPTIDWNGDISVTPQENGEILHISLFINAHALRGFLDQFKDLNLTLVPADDAENENQELFNTDDQSEGVK